MPKVPGTGGIFGWIKNFIGNILMGLFLMKLVDNAGMFKGLMNLIKGVSGFIADVGIKLIDAFATFIDWGYKAYDATKGFLQNFGVDPKLFDKFAGAISGLIDALIIASIILAARGDDKDGPDGPDKRGKPRRKPGVTTGRGGKKPRLRIPGTGPKVTRGGKKPGIRLPGTDPKVTGTSGGIKLPKLPGVGPKVTGAPGPKVTGAPGVVSKAVKAFSPKVVMPVLRPIFQRIPIFGGLIDFAVSLALGEPVGRAAAKAVGATLGAGLGSLIPVPGVGTVAGGILGDLVGGAVYDAVTKGAPEEPTGVTSKEAKVIGAPTSFANQSGGLGALFQEGGQVNKPGKKNKRKNKITRTIGGSRKKPTIRRLIQKPSPEQLPKTPTPTDRFDNETRLKSKQRAWWDFLGWAGTGEVDKTTEYLTEKITNVGDVLGKDDYFGPLLRATSKVILNQDITPKDVKNVGLGINYLLNTGLEKKKITTATRAYAKGGVVDNALGLDVSSWVEDSFKKTMKTDISDIDLLSSRRFTKSMTDTQSTTDVYSQTTTATGVDTSTSDTSTTDTTDISKRVSTSTSNAVFGTTAQRRLLNTISWAEGTGKGYGVVYGGGISPELAEGKMTISQVLKFMETSPLYKRDRYNSDATGRYQFMSYTLREEAKKQGIPFDTLWTPELQDKMILSRLATMRGVTAEMIEKEGMSDNIIDRLAPEFASFPNLIGPDSKGRVGTNTSYYGQGGKSAEAIKKYYGETTGEGTAITLQEPSSPASAASPESLRPVETSSQTQPSGRVSPSKQNQSGKTLSEKSSPTPPTSPEISDSKDKKETKDKKKLSGEEIAGKLGDFMTANRGSIGVTGSIHQWLPRFPPKASRSYASYHNENRALDIGGWSPSSPEGGGVDEQAPVIAALLKWNKENGFNPVELIHGSPAFKGVGSYRI
jgi:muramidase (phage lysozyme)